MALDRSYDVIVVGGGAVGCAVGRELADDHEILVVERGEIGGGASGMAAGLTAPTLFAYDRPELARHANEFLREFSGTDGFDYDARPRLELAYPDEEAVAREQADRMASYGFPVSFVDSGTIAARHPALDVERFAGAIEIADAGFVDDTYVYTRSLARDAKSRGAEILTGVEVTGIATSDGSVVGVETPGGVIEAPHVVVATGWHARELLSDVVHVPTRPFLLQAASVALERGFGPDAPLGRLPAEGVYFRPQHDGNLRLGGGEYLVDDPADLAAGVEDAERVEAAMNETGRTAQEVIANGIDDTFEEQLREVAPLFVEEFSDPSEVEITAGWGSVDAATADGEPIVDEPRDAPDGLIVSTGFNGLGITKSPIAAAAVRSLVTGEDAPFDVEGFALDRLPDGTDFPLQDTFAMGRE
ncbi:NAD(P)/FAD-dependent oxidoreductase [Salinirubellus sp. GCM10025818]|uniref:NAD(P)/FAD-dependent oxidoreductase n=1 Tax=Salinirubellus TaxID=2162630 RepID=UPI0030D1FA5F